MTTTAAAKKTLPAENVTWLQPNFETLEANLNGEKSLPIHELRKSAFEQLKTGGFPSTKDEDWRYTNLQPTLGLNFKSATPLSKMPPVHCLPAYAAGEAARVVFVNGFFSEELSHGFLTWSSDTSVSTLKDLSTSNKAKTLFDQHFSKIAEPQKESFVALNTSFVQDGLLIGVPKGTSIEQPLHIVHLHSSTEGGQAIYPRLLVVMEEGAQATLVESFFGIGSEESLTASVFEAVLEENAKLTHHKLQFETASTFHYGHVGASLKSNSEMTTNVYTFGGKMVRNEIMPVLNGENIQCGMNGLSVVAGEQHVDNFTVIDHAEPHCESTELFKGIVLDRAKSAFSGTIIVRPDAQKTNAIQSNANLLLSPDATSNSRPQLKIWADDVKCTHGATVGQLDEQALFYLRSRGIPESRARDILIHAYAGEVIELVDVPEVKQFLESQLLQKLSGPQE